MFSQLSKLIQKGVEIDPGKRSDGWSPALFSEKDYGLGGSVQRRGNLEKGCFLLCARRGEEKERGQMEVDL